MSEIKHALTAEEWEEHLAHPDMIIQPVRDVRTYSRHDQHQLAAKHLYGQPYGFTHEDVAILRGSATALVPSDLYYPLALRESVAMYLRSLADRISALLPPETE
jgi:hypothetical protein